MSPEVCVKAVIRLYAAAGRRPPGEVDHQVYFEGLADLADDDVNAAVDALCRLDELRPSVGAIRREVDSARRRNHLRNALPPPRLEKLPDEVVRPELARARAALVPRPREERDGDTCPS